MNKLIGIIIALIGITLIGCNAPKLETTDESPIVKSTNGSVIEYIGGGARVYLVRFSNGLQCVTSYRGSVDCNWSCLSTEEN